MQDDPNYVRQAFAAGATGYILKEAADTDLVAAVREVAAGRTLRSPQPRRAHGLADARGAEAQPAGPSRPRAGGAPAAALGHTNQEISEQLYISVRTAETHRAHVMQKLRISTRAELVRYALEHGFLDADS